MPGWWAPDDESEVADPALIEVEDTPNEVVAVLLGPDSNVLSVLYERPRVRFGFAGWRTAPSRIERSEG